jgi:hypothetical protein
MVGISAADSKDRNKRFPRLPSRHYHPTFNPKSGGQTHEPSHSFPPRRACVVLRAHRLRRRDAVKVMGSDWVAAKGSPT